MIKENHLKGYECITFLGCQMLLFFFTSADDATVSLKVTSRLQAFMDISLPSLHHLSPSVLSSESKSSSFDKVETLCQHDE